MCDENCCIIDVGSSCCVVPCREVASVDKIQEGVIKYFRAVPLLLFSF
jgi:hypothetical protein